VCRVKTVLSMCVWALVSSQALGALIAEWQFNSYAGGLTSTADYGSQAGAGMTLAIANGTKDNQTIGTGTTLNQYLDSSPNNSLDIFHGPSGNNSKQDTLTIQLTGTGLSGFVLSYACKDTGGALNTWSYSLDGTTFNPVTTITPTSSYATYTVDFNGITALNNATTVYFRDSFNTTGTLSFDNILVAVPEPIHYALPLFGLMVIAGTAGRSYLGRLRKARCGAPAATT
jgi:hypothetical protein